jgi:ribosomal protein S18 acetylase RimI-like enzyme
MNKKSSNLFSILGKRADIPNSPGKTRFNVRPVLERDRQPLANLLHFETHVHRHLDWRAPLDWINSSPFLVAERDGQVKAALACPPDPEEIAWIQLFAVSSDLNIDDCWEALWPPAQSELRNRRTTLVAAIPLQKWFQDLLETYHFQQITNVIMLKWQPGSAPIKEHTCPLTIRPMNLDDLPAVQMVDEAAFPPLWRHSLFSLELAFRQAAVATVAEDEDGIAAYQISTANPMGGHLARLAVHPDRQEQGIGSNLVYDMLSQFDRRGAVRVTVNTQHDNTASLALYKHAGFISTNEVFPVYQFRPARRVD